MSLLNNDNIKEESQESSNEESEKAKLHHEPLI